MDTPEQILSHEQKYKTNAWQDYTIEELEWWVKLLRKRAGHRNDPEKKSKDLDDADNYQAMLEMKLR